MIAGTKEYLYISSNLEFKTFIFIRIVYETAISYGKRKKKKRKIERIQEVLFNGEFIIITICLLHLKHAAKKTKKKNQRKDGTQNA